MNVKNINITITDWACNLLYSGPCNSKEVDKVLDANRCSCHYKEPTDKNGQDADCEECDDTGYSGDIEILWEDSQNDEGGLNVYDYINY